MRYLFITLLIILVFPLVALTADDTLYQEGLKYLQQGENTKAVEVLERFTRLQPKHVQSLQALGKAYLNLEQLELGQVTLESAHKLNKKSPDIHYLMGQLRFKQANYTQALGEFGLALYLGKKDPEVHYHIAQTYFLRGEKAKAFESAKMVLDSEFASKELKAQVHLLLSEQTSGEEALNHCQRVLELTPDKRLQEQSHLKRSHIYAEQGKPESVIQLFFTLLEQDNQQKDEKSIQHHYTLLWKQLSQIEDLKLYLTYLIDKMEQLYQQYPDDRITREQLIHSYRKNNQSENLLAFYRQEMLLKGPQLPPTEQATLFRQMADIHLELGYIEFAYDNYKRATEKDPTDYYSSTQLGLLLLVANKFSHAVKTFKELLEKQPLNESIKLYLAYAYVLDNQADKAKHILDELKAETPQDLKRFLKILIAYKKNEPMPELLQMLLNPTDASRN